MQCQTRFSEEKRRQLHEAYVQYKACDRKRTVATAMMLGALSGDSADFTFNVPCVGEVHPVSLHHI